jgi:hypothetical protein
MLKAAVHYSGIQMHQGCPRKWLVLDRHNGLGYEQKRIGGPLLVGGLVHEALDLYFQGENIIEAAYDALKTEPFKTWIDSNPESYEDTDLVIEMMQAYDTWRGGRRYWGDHNLEMIEPERDFEFETPGLDGTLVIGGTFDGIVRHKGNGELYLMEHKTVKKGGVSLMLKGIEYDLQPRLYMAAAREIIDPRIKGVIYTILAKEDPTRIKLLKNGKPSKAVAVLNRTTLEHYEQSVTANGGSLMEYESELAYLGDKQDTVYTRTVAYFNTAQLDAAVREAVVEAELMEQTQRRGLKYSQPHRSRYNCPYCPCREACMAVEIDVDRAYAALDRTFKVRKERTH